jgi:VIT1/CCC1 family predicted Fe2+/Mn2+ transporter
MIEDPATITRAVDLILVGRHLERIADHATNIGEDVIYMTKGIPEDQAQKMAKDIISDKDNAHALLVKEELGINAEELRGSAFEAAGASFLLFSIGAIIPVFPFFFAGGLQAVLISTLLSAMGLFLIGASITLFTGKSLWYSGFRQVLFGLAAAAVTFGIGKIIGISIAG